MWFITIRGDLLRRSSETEVIQKYEITVFLPNLEKGIYLLHWVLYIKPTHPHPVNYLVGCSLPGLSWVLQNRKSLNFSPNQRGLE